MTKINNSQPLPHDRRLDGPKEGREITLVFEVRVTVLADDDESDGANALESEITAALKARHIEADVTHTDTEDA
jgi:hypothetical protein